MNPLFFHLPMPCSLYFCRKCLILKNLLKFSWLLIMTQNVMKARWFMIMTPRMLSFSFSCSSGYFFIFLFSYFSNFIFWTFFCPFPWPCLSFFFYFYVSFSCRQMKQTLLLTMNPLLSFPPRSPKFTSLLCALQSACVPPGLSGWVDFFILMRFRLWF